MAICICGHGGHEHSSDDEICLHYDWQMGHCKCLQWTERMLQPPLDTIIRAMRMLENGL